MTVWCGLSRDRQPRTPIAREEPVGGVGAGTPGGVIGKVLDRIARPGIEQALHGAPCRLDCIGPLEQGGVADQTIVDQCLVADRSQGPEILAVCKIHRHTVDLDLRAGPLGAETD